MDVDGDEDFMDISNSPLPIPPPINFGQPQINPQFSQNIPQFSQNTQNFRTPVYKNFNIHGNVFELTDRYNLKQVIGHGAYGTVCSAFDSIMKQQVAIKKCHNVFSQSNEYQKRIYREIKILQHFDHENVIGLIDIIPPKNYKDYKDVYFVLELMDTDLKRVINSDQQLSDEHIQFFLYQILKALKCMHTASVLHRDLKPENILLNSDCDLKICDFGLARGVDFETINPVMSTPYVATRYYRSPELLLMWERCTKAIDVWSVGCIFGEMLQRKPMFMGKNYLHQLKLIINVLGTPAPNEIRACEKAKNYILTLPKVQKMPFKYLFPNANPLAVDLLTKMLEFDPLKRITVEGALEHAYMKELHESEDEPCSKKFDFSFEEKLNQNKNTNMKKLIYDEVKMWNIKENNYFIQQ